MTEIDADGINGDTQDGVPLMFPLATEKTGHALAFEPEGGPADEALAWNLMTWGQYLMGWTRPDEWQFATVEAGGFHGHRDESGWVGHCEEPGTKP